MDEYKNLNKAIADAQEVRGRLESLGGHCFVHCSICGTCVYVSDLHDIKFCITCGRKTIKIAQEE